MTERAARPAGFGADSRDCFEEVLAWLEGDEAAVMSHGKLEDELEGRGRELLRRMLQDHLTLRAANGGRGSSRRKSGGYGWVGSWLRIGGGWLEVDVLGVAGVRG